MVELDGHAAVGRPVALVHEPSRRYPTTQPARAGAGLTDGLHGSWRFADGRWAGWEGTDLIATVDLGEATELREVSIRFYQDANAWIFLPLTVRCEVSPDGRVWRAAGEQTADVPATAQDRLVRTFAFRPGPPAARFVRLAATSRRTCPDWHLGSGQPCWLFADELVCRTGATTR